MALSLLEQAKTQFAKKKYSEVISLLQPHVLEYKDSFEYYLYLGLAFMYTGEISLALDYFAGARKIKLTDPNLLSAQGTLHLRRGDTNRAIDYYLQALNYDPNCKVAKDGLDFLRHHNTAEEIGDFIQSGEIKKLYPDPTKSYKQRKDILKIFTLALAVLAFVFLLPILVKALSTPVQKRKDLSPLVLERYEKQNAVENTGKFELVLTKDEIVETYEKAHKYFQDYRDNMAQYEVNRILLSNASDNIKNKAKLLSEYFEEPGFDTIKDIFDYKTVSSFPEAYLNCFVVWRGTATNVEALKYNMSFFLLVGYDTKTRLDGLVYVLCPFVTTIDTEIPIEVLGKVQVKQGELRLEGVSIYQSGKPLNLK